LSRTRRRGSSPHAAPGIEGQVLHLGSGRGVRMRDLLEIAMNAAGSGRA
jgi:hypothetical protein